MSMSRENILAQKRAWLRRNGYTKDFHVMMDHLAALEMDLDELGLLQFIDRLQNEPPKRYIPTLNELASAVRVGRSTLYRMLNALSSPLRVGEEVLRPAYIQEEDIERGIRYSFDGLYDHLEMILVSCTCRRCTRYRERHPPAPGLSVVTPLVPLQRQAEQAGTVEGVFRFYQRKGVSHD